MPSVIDKADVTLFVAPSYTQHRPSLAVPLHPPCVGGSTTGSLLRTAAYAPPPTLCGWKHDSLANRTQRSADAPLLTLCVGKCGLGAA